MSDHYDDPTYYDQAYRRRRHDVDYYVALASQTRGPTLELGCGTGRVTLAIAKAGHPIVGIDAQAAMIKRAGQRARQAPANVQKHVSFRKGDIRRFRSEPRYPLVIAPFNVFMHLYTRSDVERALSTVRHHLTPRGRFVFDVLLPDPASLGRDPNRGYRAGHVRRDGVRLRYTEYFDYDPDSQIQTTLMDFEHPTDPRRSFASSLTQRQFFPAELRALLHYNGFTIVSHHGDFSGGPITVDSESQVIVARATP